MSIAQREIKFRAKMKNANNPIKSNWLFGYVSQIQKGNWFIDTLGEEYIEIEEKSIGQYTGLKDKNGKEIYEGDILSLGGGKRLMLEVVYKAPFFCRKWIDKTAIRVRGEIEPLAWNTDIVYEVVGNRFENPELLEESK